MRQELEDEAPIRGQRRVGRRAFLAALLLVYPPDVRERIQQRNDARVPDVFPFALASAAAAAAEDSQHFDLSFRVRVKVVSFLYDLHRDADVVHHVVRDDDEPERASTDDATDDVPVV